MYCYLSFFMDKSPKKTNSRLVLDIFEMFESELGKTYDYINHVLFNPDGNGYVINRKYHYNQKGKEKFLNSEIVPLITGKYGDTDAPFVTATCKNKFDQYFSDFKVSFFFPEYNMPMQIEVIYKEKNTKKMSFSKYTKIISYFHKIGFHVNNSMWHVYNQRNEATSFMRMSTLMNTINPFRRRNAKSIRKHMENRRLNNIVDVFCANSIVLSAIDEEKKNRIIDIVGNNNVLEIDDVLVFALPNSEKIRPIYRIKYMIMISKLRKFFKTNKEMTSNGSREA